MRFDDRAALIAAIREAPDDDAPRLVFADWLEEQGDEASVARAEFIRIQLERARLPIEDERHSPLQARELRLLKRWATTWCGAHFAFKKVRFRRGFIEFVHLHLTHWLHHRRQLLALEPVRDLRLTGWHRASDDLVRRVAACQEWGDIETLRIHHQGPHKDPRGEVITLLESPHLSRLRALHCARVAWSAEERDRFERLPVLRQLRALQLPELGSWPRDAGEWFSMTGGEFAARWENLRLLSLPTYLGSDVLQRLSRMPFWARLTSLTIPVPDYGSSILMMYRDRLPPELCALRITGGEDGIDSSECQPLLEQLAERPLQAFHLSGLTRAGAELANMLSSSSRWALCELSLRRCRLTQQHCRALAAAPWASSLRYLDLADNAETQAHLAQLLFSSPAMRSLVHLDLSGSPFGESQAATLSQHARSLRSLHLDLTRLGPRALVAQFRAGSVPGLNWLSVGGSSESYGNVFSLQEGFTDWIASLPHLACLEINGPRPNERALAAITACPSLPWLSIPTICDSVYTARAPERHIPLDAALDPPHGR